MPQDPQNPQAPLEPPVSPTPSTSPEPLKSPSPEPLEEPAPRPIIKSSDPAPSIKTPKKSGNKLLPVVIILALLTLAGIGTSVFAFIQSSQKDAEISDLKDQTSEVSDLKNQIAEKDKLIASLKAEKPEVPKDDESTTPTTPQTNSYSLFADNLAKNYSVSVFGHYYHYTGSDNVERTVQARVDKSGHLAITETDDNDKIIAEADGVINVYYIHIGNGGVPYFYILYKDGKISRISLAENGNRTIEPLNDYKDIISVVEGTDLFAYLIDINGNVYQTF